MKIKLVSSLVVGTLAFVIAAVSGASSYSAITKTPLILVRPTPPPTEVCCCGTAAQDGCDHGCVGKFNSQTGLCDCFIFPGSQNPPTPAGPHACTLAPQACAKCL